MSEGRVPSGWIIKVWNELFPKMQHNKNGLLFAREGNGLHSYYFVDEKTKLYKVHFYLTELPGCCGYMVAHNITNYRGARRTKSLLDKLYEFRERLADGMGYTAVIATLLDRTTDEVAVLESRGYEKIDSMINDRTDNSLTMYRKFIK